jgi:hypothetical protein
MLPGFIPRLHVELAALLSNAPAARPGERAPADRYAPLRPLLPHLAILNHPSPPEALTTGAAGAGRAPAFAPGALAWVGGSLAGYVVPSARECRTDLRQGAEDRRRGGYAREVGRGGRRTARCRRRHGLCRRCACRRAQRAPRLDACAPPLWRAIGESSAGDAGCAGERGSGRLIALPACSKDSQTPAMARNFPCIHLHRLLPLVLFNSSGLAWLPEFLHPLSHEMSRTQLGRYSFSRVLIFSKTCTPMSLC